MKNVISFRILLIILLVIMHRARSNSFQEFECIKNDDNENPGLPKLPPSFSTNIRANFHHKRELAGYTTEIKYAVNGNQGMQLYELKSSGRKIQYIVRKDQNVTLKITYKEDEYPLCEVQETTDIEKSMHSNDAGPNGILLKTILSFKYPKLFYPIERDFKDGIAVEQWEGCLEDPKINVLFSFAVPEWGQSYNSSSTVNYIAKVLSQIDDEAVMTAYFSKFVPFVPDSILFQPPEDVYCKGLKSKRSIPQIKDFFSYNAEIITYRSSSAYAPIVTHRKVYYDYIGRLSRVDFYDALAQDADMFANIIAQKKSIIHDFDAGVQYDFNSFRGKCTQDSFKSTFNVISSVETAGNKMLNGKEFFWLNNTGISYNGQFPVRGIMADVYTGVARDPQTKVKSVVSWYFSTRETQVVEDVNVEQNVLLRMSIRPETGFGKEGVVVINFYDFLNEQTSIDSYDITTCYNEASSKLLVLTFTANPLLKGSEKLIKLLAHSAIKKVTGIKNTRISVREVALNEKYLFVEFYLLDTPSKGKESNKEISLDEAMKRIKTAMSARNLTLEIPVNNKTLINVEPEPNGLNVFAGERIRRPTDTGYKEGSVIGMAVGMLLLGFLLGGVTLNLVVSRKFGVSLLQKGKYGQNGPFSDSNESSM